MEEAPPVGSVSGGASIGDVGAVVAWRSVFSGLLLSPRRFRVGGSCRTACGRHLCGSRGLRRSRGFHRQRGRVRRLRGSACRRIRRNRRFRIPAPGQGKDHGGAEQKGTENRQTYDFSLVFHIFPPFSSLSVQNFLLQLMAGGGIGMGHPAAVIRYLLVIAAFRAHHGGAGPALVPEATAGAFCRQPDSAAASLACLQASAKPTWNTSAP